MYQSSVDIVRSFYERRSRLFSHRRPYLAGVPGQHTCNAGYHTSEDIHELFRVVENVANERLSVRIQGIPGRSRVGDTFVHLEFERLGAVSASIRRLTEIVADLELELHRSPIVISLSNTISIDIPLPAEDRNILTTQELYLELGGYHDGWKVPFGRYSDGTLAMFDLERGSHTLVAGTTGSGKTEFLRTIVSTIGQSYSPVELELVIADRKGQMQEFRSLPNLVQPIATTEHEFRQLLVWLSKEIQGREYLGTSVKSAGVPKLLVVIDEIQGFHAREELAEFLARGRSSGVVFIVATQNPHHSVLPSTLTCNLDTRVCFKTATPSQGVLIVGDSQASNLLGAGDGLISVSGQTKRFQGALTMGLVC